MGYDAGDAQVLDSVVLVEEQHRIVLRLRQQVGNGFGLPHAGNRCERKSGGREGPLRGWRKATGLSLFPHGHFLAALVGLLGHLLGRF